MNTFTNSTKGLADSVRHMVDEADQFLKVAAESGDAKFDSVRGKFVDRVRRMRENLDDLESEAVHQTRRAARRADHVVRAHPYQAIGIAAAVGLLIGLLGSRR
jgi:ElaB/YqjD/DUF883 family membrane-anchored ribosome-binding protein